MTLCGNPESIESVLALCLHHLATQVFVNLMIVMTFGLFEFFVKNSTFSNFILVIVVSNFGSEALFLSVGIFHFYQVKVLIKHEFRDRCLFWSLRISVLRHTYLPSKTCRKLALWSI